MPSPVLERRIVNIEFLRFLWPIASLPLFNHAAMQGHSYQQGQIK